MSDVSAAGVAASERQRISAIRMQLLEAHPFWGHLLLQMELVPDAAMGHLAATDCLGTIWYNPHNTAKLSDAALGFVLAHEIGHLAYESRDRQHGRDGFLWNCATDYAINRIVAGLEDPLQFGCPMYEPPEGILLDRRFDGLTAEAIYERLATAPGQLGGLVVRDDAVDGLPVTGHGGGLDVHLPTTLDDEAHEALAGRLREAAAHWASTGKQGHAPGDTLRDLDAGRGHMPWRRLLRAFLGASLAVDEYDPQRPNRRWLAEDVFRPGLGSERIGHIVVAIDSSGSMSKALLSTACAELRAIVTHAAEAQVIVADARVHETFALDDVEPWLARRRIAGGGGTDHRPVFDQISAQRQRPDAFIGITDLMTTFPTKRPNYPVLWLAPPGAPTPPFGRTITLTQDRR